MSDCVIKKIIERYLKSIDEDFLNLVLFTKYTSLYEYKNEEWASLDIYGTFVLYTRKEEDLQLTIFNRIRLNDFTIKINNLTKVKIHDDILTILTDKKETYGIWFNDKNSLFEVYKKIKQL